MSENIDLARDVLVTAIDAARGVVQLPRKAKDFVIERLIADELIARDLMDESQRLSPLTPRALADALNRKIFADYGIDVGDLLDAESVKRALKKEALRIVADRLGVDGGKKAMAQALRSRVRDELIKAARSGDTEILEAIYVGARAVEDAERSSKPDLESQAISNFSEAGEKNRERQARYRANHKRVWVAK